MAIIFVMLVHGNVFLPERVQGIINLFTFDGVSIFFVLSGFLIGRIIIKNLLSEDLSFSQLRSFWIRRWFRTLPNYFLVLIVLTFIAFFEAKDIRVSEHGSYFVFLQNFAYPHPAFFPEAWSLSVEEWFYLLFPLLLFGLIKLGMMKPINGFLWLAILVFLLCHLYRYQQLQQYNVNSFELWDDHLRKQVASRLDSIMVGVMAAWFALKRSKFWKANAMKLFMVGITLFIMMKCIALMGLRGYGVYNCVFSFTITSLGFSAAIFVFMEKRD